MYPSSAQGQATIENPCSLGADQRCACPVRLASRVPRPRTLVRNGRPRGSAGPPLPRLVPYDPMCRGPWATAITNRAGVGAVRERGPAAVRHRCQMPQVPWMGWAIVHVQRCSSQTIPWSQVSSFGALVRTEECTLSEE